MSVVLRLFEVCFEGCYEGVVLRLFEVVLRLFECLLWRLF